MTKDESPRLPLPLDHEEENRTHAGRWLPTGTNGRYPMESAGNRSPSRPAPIPGLRRSREWDREDAQSFSRGSSANSHILSTPKSENSEPPSKRHVSPLRLLKPNETWQMDSDALYAALGASKNANDIPIPPQAPIIAYPAQYGWTLNDGSQNQNQNHTQPNDRGVALDPALSSLRSSAAQPGAGINIPPELHFPDETTLNSATQSPGNLADLAGEAVAIRGDEGGDGGLAPGGGDGEGEGEPKPRLPFSRSPDLRVSHKIAERKRRKEMKELFDELRELLPAERGTKSSKWEILSKAIDYVTALKAHNNELIREVERHRREVEMARGGGPAAYPSATFNAFPLATSYPPAAAFPVGSATPQQGLGQGQSQSGEVRVAEQGGSG